MLVLARLMRGIERINIFCGHVSGWLMLLLVLLVTGDVISRYFFNTGWVAIQELEWWLYSMVFLLGAGYTYVHDGHVRVDIIYSRFSPQRRRYVDLICSFLFLFPMCLLVIITSFKFTIASWEVREFSPDPGGLPAYYLLKAFILLGFLLLGLQGIVRVHDIIKELCGGDSELEETKAR